MRNLVLCFVAAAGIAWPQVTYNAVTDRVIRPLPPTPAMGPANTVINDPIYGNPIVRATDGATYPDYPNTGCVTPAAAMANNWNANSTRFYLYCSGMMVFPFNLDPVTMQVSRINPTPGGEGGLYLDLKSPSFSFTNPDLIYGNGNGNAGHSSNIIWEFNFATGAYTPVVDISQFGLPFTSGVGSSSISADDHFTAPFNGIQDTFNYIVYLDLRTKARKILDTKAATVDGRPVTFDGQTPGFGIHLVNIDKGGRYVVISKGNGSAGPNLLVWDTVNDTFKHVFPYGTGHYSLGYGQILNGNGFPGVYMQWFNRPLGDPAAWSKLVVPDVIEGGYGGKEEHTSWNNAQPNLQTPAITALTRQATSTNPPGPWDDEIIAISTDPANPAIYRIGHTFALYEGGNFWDLPRGNISPDGRWYIFTSNWRKTLETPRDSFIIRLPLVGLSPTATVTDVHCNIHPSVEGQPVTISASISPADATGTVRFFDGQTEIGSASVSGGVAAISTAALTAGAHAITASYQGCSTHAASTSLLHEHVVDAASGTATTTALASSLNPAAAGQSVTLTATVSPAAATGDVQFREGATVLGTATLAGGTASITVTLAPGTYPITAHYAGDADYNASASAVLNQSVDRTATTATLGSSLNPAPGGQAVTFTAVVSPAAATGVVQFLRGATVLSAATLSGGTASVTLTLAPGTHSVVASYVGDATYAASTSAQLDQTVSSHTTATALSSNRNPASIGQSVTFTATLTPSAATGSVQFFDGGTLLGSAPLSGGAAALTTTSLAVGAHMVTASYSGDASCNSSTSAPLTQQVSTQLTATATAVMSSLNGSLPGQEVTFTATVTPAGAAGDVEFLDGAVVIGTATLGGGTALLTTTALATGSHSITARYLGSAAHTGSTSAVFAQTVQPTLPTTTKVNLSQNAGYETGTNWSGLTLPGRAFDTTLFVGGVRSLRIASSTKAAQVVTQNISVFAGVRYIFTAMVKTQAATSHAQVLWLDGNGKALGTTSLSVASGITGWQMISGSVFSPAQSRTARLTFGVAKSPTAGTVWIDEVTFKAK